MLNLQLLKTKYYVTVTLGWHDSSSSDCMIDQLFWNDSVDVSSIAIQLKEDW